MGSIFRLKVQALITIANAKNWKKQLATLFILDAVLSGTVHSTDNLKVTRKDLKLIRSLINTYFVGQSADSKIPSFVVDMFYNYSWTKTKVVFNWESLNRALDNKVFLDIFMEPMWNRNDDKKKQNENCNIFRPIVYQLFPNLEQITLLTSNIKPRDLGVYPLDPRFLLNLLERKPLPLKFNSVQIQDIDKQWIRSAFNAKIIQEFKERNISVDFEAHGKVMIISGFNEQ